ncbi:amino acid ABC transporter substrate-binding protein, PAAT family /amino acid ABC transporter membrane protein, PAAT family [Pedococcus dokdonensis]|uniref:Amino acid ABC transporter substrate-binding protein, PAAT family /amino acid ABC transporter membrane protein, PAAT family n=1 Tax=Pedococcus dokdonensis TaxID=443156 RepID=A0A1H0TE44_9MICO|nr:amino acid ABC transporter substrate-binding protein, PAAT family /amino acid ABC transporter membrane protein, PAAT family [Pedococcus dokdonensis]
MKRASASLFIALLGLLYAAVPASAATPGGARADGIPPVLKVGTEGVYPPFSYHGGAGGGLTGYDIDVMNAIGKHLGVKVEYVETPFDSMFAALEAGRFDVVANQITFNEERNARYDLSDPYVETTGVLVVRKGDTAIKTIADLKGKRAAENVTSNWAQVAKDAGATVVGVDDMGLAIDNLEQGRVDALVNDKLAIRNYLSTHPDSEVKVVAETDDISKSVFAAKKGSGYLPQLNKAVADLKADGTLDKIYAKYFDAKRPVPTTVEIMRDNAWPMARAALTKTIPLTAISFTLGMVIALAIGLMRMSKQPVVAGIARLYISFIRGTPLLVQLFLIFYALPQLGVKFDPFPAAVIAFSLNVGGYAAEIVRSSIESLPKGQWEAASTVGMDYATTLRRIILPQAARTAVPPLSNTLISLVKDTSLAAVILVIELFRQAQLAAAPSLEYLALYGMAAVYYWVICLALSFAQSRTETRLNRFVAA